jgi:2-methylcitrate dehydratase PrpD
MRHSTPGATLAATLAEFVRSTPAVRIPELARERARMSLASTIASASMGFGIRSTEIIRSLELDDGGAGEATVWFSDARLPASSAARVNAVASDAAASDDSDLRSIAHIGTIVSTCGVAVAEATGASGAELLDAMVLGYEVAGRIDEALTPGRMRRGFHGSVSTVFGATATTGRLLGLSHDELTHALVLAATSIGGMAISADTSWGREYHAGHAASTGIAAARAAQRGFRGEPALLEAPRGFLEAMGAQSVDEITEGLGESWDIVTDMAIKLMPGAHPFHAVAEAAAEAGAASGARVDDLERVIVNAAVQWTTFHGDPHPRDLVDAAHSLQYFVAAAIVDGAFGWEHMDEQRMLDPEIARVQDLVELDPDPTPLPDRFPHRHGGTVTIILTDGRSFSATCVAPRGSGPRGVEWADVDDKYRRLAPIAGLSHEQVETSLGMLHGFGRSANVADLLGTLRPTP